MSRYKQRVQVHDDLLQDLLHARGVLPADAPGFLEPEFERDSHDPFLLPDMAKAVERILLAVKHNETVAVWSDYDCDGIPGGVMLADFLRELGLSVVHYIPHRHKEGYGLNQEGLDELARQGITLVITIDLGTTEHEHIVYAKTKGIEIIVTDHHIVQNAELHPALALINPKRPDSNYPFDGLCGAGVAWKLVQALILKSRSNGQSFDYAEGKEKWYLDLVGMATLSDMVPLVGENRMLARYGLLVMRKNRRPGLAALLKMLRIKPGALVEDDIGFMIAPRINAASRMDSPSVAARLLATHDEHEAEELARTLNKINDERKGLVAATVKEANRRMEGGAMLESPVLVMGSPNWRPGILGLVANSLATAHHKPVFLWGREGGELLRGSCRSEGTVSVVSLMQNAGDILDHFGGHFASGGFSIIEDRAHELHANLVSAYQKIRAEEVEEKEIIIDRQIAVADISRARMALAKLGPFGEGNKKPFFITKSVVVARVKSFGKTANHLDLELEGQGERISGIAFFATASSFSKPIEAGMQADIVGHIETDWRGKPRIRIIDII
ncbi:MAG TPA: single-stranded-DNA-specific exonuclease RecJ [Candidatus Paceibacterota bacterium]